MTKTGIGAAVLFLVGCIVGSVSSQLVVPPARAQTSPARWEYFCFEAPNTPAQVTKALNEAGAQGWDLVEANSYGAINVDALFCTKRVLP
jgi:hypothetical protein